MRVVVLLLCVCSTGWAADPPRQPQPDLKMARLLPSGELEIQFPTYATEERQRIVKVQEIVNSRKVTVEKLETHTAIQVVLRTETHTVDKFKLGDQTGGPISPASREALEKDFTPVLIVYDGIVVLEPHWQQFYRPELPLIQLAGPPPP